MADVRIKCIVVPDDGSDGFFFRAGERWLRDKGREVRLLDYAPTLEKHHVPLGMEIEALAQSCGFCHDPASHPSASRPRASAEAGRCDDPANHRSDLRPRP